MKLKVFIAYHTYPKQLRALLEEKGFLVDEISDHTNLDPSERNEKIRGSHGILWWPHPSVVNQKITKELLDNIGPQLRVISTSSAGYDFVDLEELKKRDVKLANSTVQAPAVAEMAIALALSVSRRVFDSRLDGDRNFIEHQYSFDHLLGRDLRGSTVGILGLGNIGQAIVQRLQGFEIAEFLYTSRSQKEIAGMIKVELIDLLKRSDFVFITCALNDETRNLFNKDTFQIMKSSAILINIARGGIIDQEALAEALENRTIFGAALDVTTPEPLPKGHRLLSLPNCIITPHFGSHTMGTRLAMYKLATENLILGLEGKPMRTPVHF